MPPFTQPTFQERAALAAKAKQAALDKLKARPPVSKEVLEQRKAARIAREQAEAERRAQKLAEREQAKLQREAEKEAAKAAALAVTPELTEAEKKAARDLRYAARKNRRKK